MKKIFHACFAIILGFFFTSLSTASASSSFSFPQGRVELVSLPAANSALASWGLNFDLAPEWHIYWKNSGDSGAAPKWTWTLQTEQGKTLPNEGLRVHWPLPERIHVEGLINFGYSEETLIAFDYPRKTQGAPAKITVQLEFLVCKVECIPYFTELRLVPAVSAKSKSSVSTKSFIYPTAAPPPISWRPEKKQDSKLVTTLTLPEDLAKNVKNIEIFPEDGGTYSTAVPLLEPQSVDSFQVSLPLQDTSRNIFTKDRFLIVIEDKLGTVQAYEKELEAAEAPSFFLALLWALVGGVILNFMPCVFPVLSIKVLSFLGSDKNSQKLRRSGFFYTLGVLFSFLSLGGLLLILRASGEQIGWGFQLQSPLIASGISLLFFWLGLNFLGAFEIGQSLTYMGAKKTSDSPAGSFATGVLATVIATPCTAPFMGAALGASLAMPPINTLLIFLGLGLGMALPFLLLAYFPQALRYLPKPGLWMQKLKEFLAFPLFATVLWLLWVLSLQTSSETLLWILGLFLLVSLWVWLHKSLRDERRQQLFLTLGFLFSFWALSQIPKVPAAITAATTPANWKDFNPESVQQDLKAGKSVFIDFTAAWCITCQVNKKLVLNTDEIQQAFDRHQVQRYQADWTDKNPMIAKALESYGRNSLPVYVFYKPGSQEPVLLPELLTKKLVLDYLEQK